MLAFSEVVEFDKVSDYLFILSLVEVNYLKFWTLLSLPFLLLFSVKILEIVFDTKMLFKRAISANTDQTTPERAV